jgi:cyclophilin family peptidyl-prolyl cis-trans isomerase/HEAT repeat protein
MPAPTDARARSRSVMLNSMRGVAAGRRLLLSAMAATGAACAPTGPVEPPAPAIIRLSEADIRSVAELLRLEDGRSLDTILIARLLQDPLPEMRARAALAAGRIRDRSAAPLLLHAAADQDPHVRAGAAFALGLLGDTTTVVLEALSSLSTQYRIAGHAPAREAVAALGLLAHGAGRPALEALLRDPAAPATVRDEALLAIWRLPRATGTADLIAPHATAAETETRWRAVYALWRVGGVESVPLLLAAAADTNDIVRANAVRGLRASVTDSASAQAAALDALLRASSDAHAHVRINALRLLAAYRQPTRTLPVLVSRLNDEDNNTAVVAAQALVELGPAAASALAAVARDAQRPDGVRFAALASWSRVDPQDAGAVATQWADSARWLVRLQSAAALSSMPPRQAAPTLERLARDANQLVASRALNALVPMTDSLPHLRRIFLEQLASTHVLVRAAAAGGLCRNAHAADTEPLLLAYDRASRDPSREARTAALSALGRLIRAGVPAHRAFWARFGGEAPADPAVFRAIAQNIGTPPAAWGPVPTAGPPPPRPLAFYVDVVRTLVAPVLAGEPAPRVAIETIHGDIVLELAAAEAPLTVHNFLALVQRGYYDGTRWHRVVPNFVLQDGDPRGDGSGGPGHVIRDELNLRRYQRGTLGMALSGPDTGGGQFFITHSPQPHLDGGYTVFGRVVGGMEAADRVVQDEPIRAFRRLP